MSLADRSVTLIPAVGIGLVRAYSPNSVFEEDFEFYFILVHARELVCVGVCVCAGAHTRACLHSPYNTIMQKSEDIYGSWYSSTIWVPGIEPRS